MDPSQIQTRLLNVMSATSLAELDADGRSLLAEFGVGDLTALQELPDYSTIYRVVRTAREAVDRVRKLPLQKQVSEALCLVGEAIDRTGTTAKNSLEATIHLVDKVLVPEWPEAEQKSYQERLQILHDWKDYFLSYTRRQAPETNATFRELITFVRGDYPSVDQIKSENFLAHTILLFMDRQNIKGFFDERDIRIGEVIGDKVRPYCRQNFGFVQLVEDVCFQQGQDVNWCFEEYQEFKSAKRPVAGIEPRCFFFLAGKDLTKPAKLPKEYKQWFDEVEKRLHSKLAGANGETLKFEVGRAAIEILEYKDAVIKEILFGG